MSARAGAAAALAAALVGCGAPGGTADDAHSGGDAATAGSDVASTSDAPARDALGGADGAPDVARDDAGATGDAIAPAEGGADAAASDGGAAGGPSRCGELAGALFCDDFERAVVMGGAVPWTLDADNGTATIDATRAARGTRSLHVHTGITGGSRALLVTTRGFPVAGDSFYGRVFVYVGGQAPRVHSAFTIARGRVGTTDAEMRMGVADTLGTNYWLGSGLEYGADGDAFAAGRWACVEWHYEQTGAYHFWVDEVEDARLAITASHTPAWTGPHYTAFSLGLLLYHTDTAPPANYDLWFDEIALAPSRIGCR